MAIVAMIGVNRDDAEAEDSVGHGPGMQNARVLRKAGRFGQSDFQTSVGLILEQ